MSSQSPNVPILDFPWPSIIIDTILIERTSNKLGNYAAKEPGAPFDKTTHSEAQVTAFGAHEFLGQKASQDDEWIQRFYGKVPSTQDIANWEVGYSGESASHPIFQRRYLEKRDSYTRRADRSVLPGLYRINVSVAGSGFTSVPSVVFSGGTGSGGTAIAVLDNNGGVAKIVIKTEGTYTVAPAVSLVGGGGSGAVAVAWVQGAAVLVKEDVTDNAPEPYRSLYIVVTRIYETLPGPWIPFTRYDDKMGPIQGQRRAVANTGQVSSLTSTIKTTYEGRNGSSIVLWEIQEIFGAGVSGFIQYPVLFEDERSAAVRGGRISTSSTIVTNGDAPQTGSTYISSTVKAINEQFAVRTTVDISSLPTDEVTAYWDWVNLPLCVLDIVHTVDCNLSPFASVSTNYDERGGAAVLRKHRRTVSYKEAPPINTDPDLSGAAFEVASLAYDGRFINVRRSNVLNDAISYDADFSYSDGEGVCVINQAYDFPATSPSATEFLAGAWYTKRLHPEEFGQSMWKITKEEYYSAQGNPSI